MEELLAAPEVRRHEIALLIVDDANVRARNLYASLAFENVLVDFRFAPEGPAKRVLGLRLGPARGPA